MRSMMRLLLVGILLCVGLQVSEVQPVYADGKLERGNYQGFMELAAESRTQTYSSTKGGTFNFILFVDWQMKSKLRLKVIDEQHALLTTTGTVLPFEVQHGGSNKAITDGMSCTWWDNMAGTGNFEVSKPFSSPGSTVANNFAAGMFTLNAFSGKKIKWINVDGQSYGDAPDCAKKWGKELAKVQQAATDQISGQINKISFVIDPSTSSSDTVCGTISLPDWARTIEIKDGQAERTAKGHWCVYKEGSEEWKTWMEQGQKKK